MPAGRRGRLATWTVRVVIGAALLIDVPQQLALNASATDRLVSLHRHAVEADAGGAAPRRTLVAHSAAVVVSGVAWLAAVAAPYAEPDVETP
jgi:uncharacterized protein YfaQ (DUF2300 family)